MAYCRTSSTRRLSARPSTVLLVALGLEAPKPAVTRRSYTFCAIRIVQVALRETRPKTGDVRARKWHRAGIFSVNSILYKGDLKGPKKLVLGPGNGIGPASLALTQTPL